MIVKSGRFKGGDFQLEGTVKDVCGDSCLAMLACKGNHAAYNAIHIDGYTINDDPCYYGKIGALGHIISAKDLGLEASQ